MKSLFPNMPLPQDLTYEFLGTFARCEYALKSSGFAKGGASDVSANWDAFAETVDGHFRQLDEEIFKNAAAYLLAEPPRKQVLIDGRVEWRHSPPNVKFAKARQVLLMVRRIRNNLFHGSKIWTPESLNRDRDIELVKAGLVILKHSVLLHREVQRFYENGTF